MLHCPSREGMLRCLAPFPNHQLFHLGINVYYNIRWLMTIFKSSSHFPPNPTRLLHSSLNIFISLLEPIGMVGHIIFGNVHDKPLIHSPCRIIEGSGSEALVDLQALLCHLHQNLNKIPGILLFPSIIRGSLHNSFSIHFSLESCHGLHSYCFSKRSISDHNICHPHIYLTNKIVAQA